MRGMIDFITPLAGLDTAASQVHRVASRIAQSSNPEDRVDLSQEMVSLIQAQNDFKADTKAIQTEDQMNKNLFNIVG